MDFENTKRSVSKEGKERPTGDVGRTYLQTLGLRNRPGDGAAH